MMTAAITIEGSSPLSQGRHYPKEKIGQETEDAYERRTWRQRMHSTPDGRVFIPPMAFKNGLASAAKFLGRKIPGAGQKTYTKRFESGVMCTDPIVLSVKVADVPCEELFVPSNGQRGGGSRVTKLFGKIDDWGGTTSVIVLDEAITKQAFEEHLIGMGKFIGIGRFRPENNGYYGRFEVKKVTWSEI